MKMLKLTIAAAALCMAIINAVTGGRWTVVVYWTIVCTYWAVGVAGEIREIVEEDDEK